MGSYNLILNSSNVVGSYNTTFLYKFIQGNFIVGENAEMCVSSITIPYSWFNISTAFYQNASFQYRWYSNATTYTTYTLTLPDGYYAISDINNALQNYMISQNQYLINTSTSQYYYFISLYTNTTYYTNQFILNPIPSSLPSGYTAPSGFVYNSNASTPIVVIGSNKFGNIIGYSSGLYPTSTLTTSQSILGNITPNATPVNSIIITCDMVNNYSTTPSNILDSFNINATFGANITYIPNYEKWVSIQSGSYSTTTFSFFDQNFNIIPARDPNILISILIRSGSIKEKPIPLPFIKQIQKLQFKDEIDEK